MSSLIIFATGSVTSCTGQISSFVFPSSGCSGTTCTWPTSVTGNATIQIAGTNFGTAGTRICDGLSHAAIARLPSGADTNMALVRRAIVDTLSGTYACSDGANTIVTSGECAVTQNRAIRVSDRFVDILFYRSSNPTPCTEMIGCDSSGVYCLSWYGATYTCDTQVHIDSSSSPPVQYICSSTNALSNTPVAPSIFPNGNPLSGGCGLPVGAIASFSGISTVSPLASSTSSSASASSSASSSAASSVTSALDPSRTVAAAAAAVAAASRASQAQAAAFSAAVLASQARASPSSSGLANQAASAAAVAAGQAAQASDAAASASSIAAALQSGATGLTTAGGAVGSAAIAQVQGATSVGAVAAGAASTAGAASNAAASAAAIASAIGGVGGLVAPSSGGSGVSNGRGGSSLNVGALVGGLVGGIAAFLLLILAAILCLRRRRRRGSTGLERDSSVYDGRTDEFSAFTGLSTDRVHGSRIDEGAFPSTSGRQPYRDMDEVHISAPASRPTPAPLSYMQPGETLVPAAAAGAGAGAAAYRRGHMSHGSDEPLLSPIRSAPTLEERMAAYDARPSLRAPQPPPTNRLSDGSGESDPFR